MPNFLDTRANLYELDGRMTVRGSFEPRLAPPGMARRVRSNLVHQQLPTHDNDEGRPACLKDDWGNAYADPTEESSTGAPRVYCLAYYSTRCSSVDDSQFHSIHRLRRTGSRRRD